MKTNQIYSVVFLIKTSKTKNGKAPIFCRISVNHGEIEIIEMCTALQSIFQVHIEDPYHTFIDIVNRKKDLLKFIPKLEEGILRKVEEAEGKV